MNLTPHTIIDLPPVFSMTITPFYVVIHNELHQKIDVAWPNLVKNLVKIGYKITKWTEPDGTVNATATYTPKPAS